MVAPWSFRERVFRDGERWARSKLLVIRIPNQYDGADLKSELYCEVAVSSRIRPLEAPFEEVVAPVLASMMPPGVPPLGLFRTLGKNLPMASAMRSWGGYELSRSLSLSMREREIVIDRTCARCGCEYEWGVHIALFAARVALSDTQVTSLTFGGADDECWIDERDRVLIAVVDSLHDTADVTDPLWGRLRAVLDEAQVLDLLMLTGWYHAISFAARAARVPLEQGAPRFADVAPGT